MSYKSLHVTLTASVSPGKTVKLAEVVTIGNDKLSVSFEKIKILSFQVFTRCSTTVLSKTCL